MFSSENMKWIKNRLTKTINVWHNLTHLFAVYRNIYRTCRDHWCALHLPSKCDEKIEYNNHIVDHIFFPRISNNKYRFSEKEHKNYYKKNTFQLSNTATQQKPSSYIFCAWNHFFRSKKDSNKFIQTNISFFSEQVNFYSVWSFIFWHMSTRYE